MQFENTESDIGWGIDAHGARVYLCKYCEVVFGKVDPDEIVHECNKNKPRYHNRDKLSEENKR